MARCSSGVGQARVPQASHSLDCRLGSSCFDRFRHWFDPLGRGAALRFMGLPCWHRGWCRRADCAGGEVDRGKPVAVRDRTRHLPVGDGETASPSVVEASGTARHVHEVMHRPTEIANTALPVATYVALRPTGSARGEHRSRAHEMTTQFARGRCDVSPRYLRSGRPLPAALFRGGLRLWLPIRRDRAGIRTGR